MKRNIINFFLVGTLFYTSLFYADGAEVTFINMADSELEMLLANDTVGIKSREGMDHVLVKTIKTNDQILLTNIFGTTPEIKEFRSTKDGDAMLYNAGTIDLIITFSDSRGGKSINNADTILESNKSRRVNFANPEIVIIHESSKRPRRTSR